MMRTEARTQLIAQRQIVALKNDEFKQLGGDFRTRPLRNKCEQELADARDLEKTYQQCYHTLVNGELKNLHLMRKRLKARIETESEYDLDLEESLMSTQLTIGLLLDEAEGLDFDLEGAVQ